MKNFVLGVGIFIVYLLVLGQGIETFYPAPQYDDFCSIQLDLERRAELLPVEEPDLACKQEFNDARDAHSRIVFIISLIAGIITLVVGYWFLATEPVGSALLASGIGAIFYGTLANWRNFGEVWRFVLLLVTLVFLVWLALRLNRKKKKVWQFWR